VASFVQVFFFDGNSEEIYIYIYKKTEFVRDKAECYDRISGGRKRNFRRKEKRNFGGEKRV